ncbi:MAG: hypothetical protein HWE23_13650 [Rhodobacteraceae bacterium]|nr:hypothetical protein [Paracoccaceae bacterium]
METALVRSPSPSYTAITPTSRAPEQTKPASETELPARRTVNPSADTSASRPGAENKTTQQQTAQTRALERENFLDPESESFVYVAKNKDTGEVVQQIPSESLRRIRAYEKTISEQENKEALTAETKKVAKTA